MTSLRRSTAILFALWFLLTGVALPTCSVEAQATREVQEQDEVDPCPVEEFLPGPEQRSAPARASRGHRPAHRPPARAPRGPAVAIARPHPRPGPALPLRC